jgi:hypothetical protein
VQSFSKILFATLAITLSATIQNWAQAQQLKDEGTKTKLEAFTGTIGVASIKGYVEVGTMKGTSPVRVTAMIVRDAKSGKETAGAVFEVAEIKSYGTDTSRSYVDAEELADLLSGLTYISQADATVTPMRFFEAQYSTRGGLKLVVFNDAQGQRHFLVHVGGSIGGKDTRFRIEDLPYFWDLITKAKEVIENPDRLGKINSDAGSTPADSFGPARSMKKL